MKKNINEYEKSTYCKIPTCEKNLIIPLGNDMAIIFINYIKPTTEKNYESDLYSVKT